MCIINGKLLITVDRPDGYMKGRAGKGWYIPPSGNERLRQALRDNAGQTVELETVGGMCVKIEGVR